MQASAADACGSETGAPPAALPPSRVSAWTGVGGAIALGSVIALATARSLLGDFGTVIPAEVDCTPPRCADQALLLWLMTQAGRNLYTNPLELFEAPVFYPLRHALAYSESMLSAAVFAGPIERLTGNPIVAYNAHYLATIVLSVVGMYLLVREITGDRWAGLVAGGLFGLTTERGLWWAFPPALALHWAPFFLWSWLRFLAAPWGRRRVRGVVLGLTFLAHMHAAAYHGLVLPPLLVPWAIVLMLFGPWPFRRWLASLVPLAVAGAIGAALYYPYVVVREELQYAPTGLAFALPGQYVQGLQHPLDYVAYRAAPPLEGGFVVSPLAWYVLAAAAIAVVVRRRPAATATPALGLHLGAALLLTLLGVSASFGTVMITPWGLMPGPLALLRELPGYGAMRAVVRFMMLAAFARSLVAGIAMAMLLRRIPARAGRVAAFGVLALAAADARLGTERPVHDFTVPSDRVKGYAWLSGTVPGTPIVELPYGTFSADAHAMLYSLWHRRPVMNGYAAALPKFPDVVGRLPTEVAWRALREAGVQYVVAHRSLLAANPLTAGVLAGLELRHDLIVASLDETLILAVPPSEQPPEVQIGQPLARAGWRIQSGQPGARLAIDGDPATHWRGSSAKRDETILLDLGRLVALTGIQLELGPHLLEYPRRYEVLASVNARSWVPIGGEAPTVPPLASYRRDHRRISLPLRIMPTVARWLRLRVPAYPSNAWAYSDGTWGIHEIVVYEVPGARPTLPKPPPKSKPGSAAKPARPSKKAPGVPGKPPVPTAKPPKPSPTPPSTLAPG